MSPVVLVPIVCVVGLGLFGQGFPQVSSAFLRLRLIINFRNLVDVVSLLMAYLQLANCVEIGLPMLILVIVSQQVRSHFDATVVVSVCSKIVLSQLHALHAVFATHPSSYAGDAGEVCFTCVHCNYLGFCCHSYSCWRLQPCQGADPNKLPY